MRVLEWIRELSLRMPPNVTAWSDALEAFFASRRYKLTTRVSLLIIVSEDDGIDYHSIEHIASSTGKLFSLVLYLDAAN